MDDYSIDAYLRVTGVDKFTKSFMDAQKSMDGVEKSASNVGPSITKMVGAIAGIAATVGIFRTLSGAMDQAFNRIDTMEQFDRVMTEITGSADNAAKALDETNEAVLGTAYGLDVAAKGVQDFVTRGLDVDKATERIAAWGDAVAFYGQGSNEQLASVTDALAKMQTKGSVEMDQLNRLFDVGIDAVGMYAQATGQSADVVQKALSSKEISANEFIDTVTTAMMEGTNGVTNIAGAAKEAGASWSGSFANMRAAVARGVTNIITNIDDMLDNNGLPSMRDMVADFGKQFEAVLTAAGESIPAVVEKIKEVKTALDPWMPTIQIVATSIGILVTAIASANSIMAIATTTFNILKAAFATTPIGALIAVILLLVGAFAYLWNANEEFRQFFINAWNHIKDVASSTWQTISDFVMPIVEEIVSFLMTVWGMLTEWWTENQELIRESAEVVWGAIQTVIETVMSFLEPFITQTWENIKLAIEIIWETIKTVIEIAITLIQGIMKAIMQIITGDWEGAWETVESTAESIWDSIFKFISTIGTKLWTRVKEIFQDIVDSIKEKMDESVQVVAEKVGEMPGKVVEKATEMFTAGKDLIQGLIDGVIDMGKNAVEAVKGVVENVIEKAKSMFQLASPSKLFKKFGGWVSEGLSIGISDEARKAVKSTEELVKGVTDPFTKADGFVSDAMNGIFNGSLQLDNYLEASPIDIEDEKSKDKATVIDKVLERLFKKKKELYA